MLFWRAVLAFLALPGMVAFAVPALLAPWDQPARLHAIGTAPFAIGLFLLLWCVRDFCVAGRGTLAPWDPPRHLVTAGLYRYSRNPMYVAVTLMLVGWALGFMVRALWMYAAAVALGFHLRVVGWEEPWLTRTFGDEWLQYKARVPRWLF